MTETAAVVETDPGLGLDLLTAVGRLHRWATRHAALPISPALARLLAQIEESQPVRIGDLARADQCSQPTMTTQVRRLEHLDLVRRQGDSADGRAVLITVTPAGRQVLADMRRIRAAAVAPMLERLDETERENLRSAVGVLTRLLDDASQTS
jgi:DNA-binding MarR family transcriptional regulator